MRNKLKLELVAGVIILLLGAYFAARYTSPKTEQSSLQKSYPIVNGQPIGMSYPGPEELGRATFSYAPNPPPGLPSDLPIDANPLEVVESYHEFSEGDTSENVAMNEYKVYGYFTSKAGAEVLADFEQYFKAKNYAVTSFSSGLMAEADADHIYTVTVGTKNLFQTLVTVSFLSIERVGSQSQ